MAGYYTHPNGAFIALSQETDKLMLDAGGGKSELQPLSDREFFIKSNFNRYVFTRDDKGKVSALIIKSEANETALKKINVDEAKARAARILSAAYAAKGGVEKLSTIRDIQFDSTRTIGEVVASNYFFLSSQFQTRHEARDKKTGDTTLTVSDGKNVWLQNGSRAMPSSLPQFMGFWQQAWLHFTLQPLPGKTMEVIALDEQQLSGKPMDVVLALIDGHRYVLSFDQQTHLLRRNLKPGADDFFYDDYREVAGIKLPFKVNVARFSMFIHEYKINAGLDPTKLTPAR